MEKTEKTNKTICEFDKKEINPKRMQRIALDPQFFCKNCGRVANKRKWLCEPRKLVKEQPTAPKDGPQEQ